jgi:hypothetical protein
MTDCFDVEGWEGGNGEREEGKKDGMEEGNGDGR